MLFLSFLTLFFYHGEPNLYAPVSDFQLFDRDGRTWVEFGKHSTIRNKTAVAVFFLLKGSVITTIISLGFHLIQLFKKKRVQLFISVLISLHRCSAQRVSVSLTVFHLQVRELVAM